MRSSSRLCSLLLGLIALFQQVASWTCSKEIFGKTLYISCPEERDSKDKKYCCGTEKLRYCCNTEEFSSTINAIGLIVGVLISAIVVIVIIVVISCFCCSCCLLAKRRRQQGRILYGPVTAGTTSTVPYPTQQQAAYPTQAANVGFPPQQYAPQAYAPQPYPPQPYPQPGYQAYPAPANPPPYPNIDQPPYNPNYPPPK